MPAAVLFADSITKVGAEARGAVVVNGSHGGLIAAAMAVEVGVRAAVFNDAGIGRDEAGVAGLGLLQSLGVPAAAVSHLSARIGDGRDMMDRGVISRCNALAEALGVRPGQACAAAADYLARAEAVFIDAPPHAERRVLAQAGPPEVWLLDSASLVSEADAGCIVVTGSHGALLGGRPDTAVKAPVRAALFNDAGVGVDQAGVTRLGALQARGIAAAAVSADSARIGDARSTYDDGVISTCNPLAHALGVRIGASARDAVSALSRPAPVRRTA